MLKWPKIKKPKLVFFNRNILDDKSYITAVLTIYISDPKFIFSLFYYSKNKTTKKKLKLLCKTNKLPAIPK